MREITFRAKRKDNNEWAYGDLEHNGKGEMKWVNGDEIIPETVGQFTGLTDKNGKKIFEGDIIQYCGFGYRESMGTIIYDKNFGAFVSKEHERCYVRFGDISQYGTVMGVDVIGNIHDNPELLEQL